MLHQINAEAVRSRILEQIEKELGHMSKAAGALGVTYTVLYRLIQSDSTLRKRVKELRKKMQDEGICQIGIGDWHWERM